MYKLAGNLTNAATVYIHNPSTGALINKTAFSAGNFEIKYLEGPQSVYAVAIKTDGQAEAYGNVSLVNNTVETLSDNFSGVSLDTNKWYEYINEDADIIVNDELRLQTSDTASHCGASIRSKQTFNKSGILELSCQIQPRNGTSTLVDTAWTTAIVFANSTTNERNSFYATRNTNFVTVNYRPFGTTTRRMTIHGSQSGVIQDNIGGNQFTNGLRDTFIRFNFETKQIYMNIGNGLRVGTVTIPDADFNALGSTIDIELTTAHYPYGAGAAYDLFKNLSVGTDN